MGKPQPRPTASPCLKQRVRLPRPAAGPTPQGSDGTHNSPAPHSRCPVGRRDRLTDRHPAPSLLAKPLGYDTVVARDTSEPVRNAQGKPRIQLRPESADDTRKSFTISTWAKAGAQGKVVASQDGNRTSSFILYADDSSNWRFALAHADADGWPFDYTYIANDAARFIPGTWTRLTAVYNADTGLMSLYVNGVLAGTGTHRASTSPAPSGPLVLGRFKADGTIRDHLDGGISDFAVHPYAVAPTAPGAAGPIALSASTTNCVDNDFNRPNPGNKIQIAACNGSDAQKFQILGDGTIRTNGMCLGAVNAGTANTTLIELQVCDNSGPSQRFLPRADSSIYNPVSGRCLDLGNLDTRPGTPLCCRAPEAGMAAAAAITRGRAVFCPSGGHRVQLGELVGQQAHHHDIAVPAGEVHELTQSALLHEAEPTMESQGRFVVREDPHLALVEPVLGEHETKQQHRGFCRVALAAVLSADRDPVLEPARTRVSLMRADGTDYLPCTDGFDRELEAVAVPLAGRLFIGPGAVSLGGPRRADQVPQALLVLRETHERSRVIGLDTAQTYALAHPKRCHPLLDHSRLPESTPPRGWTGP